MQFALPPSLGAHDPGNLEPFLHWAGFGLCSTGCIFYKGQLFWPDHYMGDGPGVGQWAKRLGLNIRTNILLCWGLGEAFGLQTGPLTHSQANTNFLVPPSKGFNDSGPI